MLDCAKVFALIREQGFNFFTGVPDSLLKNFCAYVTDNASTDEHVIAANEGNAVALAMGHYLGSGEPAVVYMQNSGTGNAVNPLLSLADPEVYGIPVLLIIGWRGEPGVKDEPQHVKQGRRMTELLEAMDVPWFLLPREMDNAADVIQQAGNAMRERTGPVALLVRKDTFDSYKLKRELQTDFPMNRDDAIQMILGQLDAEDVVVSTTGKASREVYEYRQAQGASGCDFLTVGGMGHTASIAMGIAQAQPTRRVVCLDGDGSLIMHMGALGVIAHASPANLVHIVINNGAHDSVGGQPTVGYFIDLPAIALACGYRKAVSVAEPKSLDLRLKHLLACAGPVMLEVKVNKGARNDLGRPKSTPTENRDALMKRLGL
jgi:phosphonopyruvate decarboxylase